MQLTLIPITRQLPEFKKAYALMKSSFPKDELISLSMWRALALRKGIHFYAIYDRKKWVGIIYTVEPKEYIYIPFLAICEKERNKGYGSQILRQLKETSSKTLAIHIEPVDSSASNFSQRVRRDAFYCRNGIEDTHYRFQFFGVPFAVYSSSKDTFDISKHTELMNWFAFHLIRFHFQKSNLK